MTAAERVRQAVVIARKDVLLEWRGRARINAIAFFGVTTLLMFSFAIGPDARTATLYAGAFLWLGLLLSSVLALSESFRVEAENDAVEGLRLLPVDALAMFLGKAVVNAALLFVLALLLLPLAVVLYGAKLDAGVGPIAGVFALGAAGVAAPGTLYAAVTSRIQAREVLLPLLLFPLVVPVLLAAVKATGLLMLGDPMGQVGSWTQLLVGFDVVYWILGSLLFARVIEE